MGFLDKAKDAFNEHSDKVADAVDQHADRIDQGIDQGSDFVSEKTGGRFDGQVEQGADRLRDGLDGLDGQDDDFGGAGDESKA